MEKSLRKHFSSLKDIIKHAIPSSKSIDYLNELKILKRKAKSKILNVAVIGEFNSGKSTFINALLRERILKEAGLPTTAAATHITRSKPRNILQFLFGARSYIRVKFDDGYECEFSKRDAYVMSYYIRKRFNIQINGFTEILHHLTAEQVVAKHVTELNIQFKTKSLPKNITLIDTPGFNPGVSDFENHLAITEEVVVKEADMAIVLIPSNAPMTGTLKDFLETNILRYLHRCVFVITKIDAVPAEERNDIVEFVKQQIVELGVPSPKIYSVSARTMLPVNKIPETMVRIWASFQKKFMTMETELWSAISIYKQITIHEHVCHMLDDLSIQINNVVQNHTSQLQNTLKILQDNNIKTIEIVTEELYKNSCIALDNFYSSLNLSSSAYRASAKETSRLIIRGGGKLRKFKDQEAPRINQSVKSNGEQYTSSIKAAANGSTDIIKKQLEIFRTTFHSHYKDMPSLEPKMNYGPQISNIVSTTIDLATSTALNNKTFFGRLFRNIGNLFRSETEIQNEVITEVNNSIETHFIHLENSVRKSIDTCKDNQKALLKQYCNEHVKKYSKDVKKLILQQKNKENNLLSAIRNSKAWMEFLVKTRREIKKEANKLSAIRWNSVSN